MLYGNLVLTPWFALLQTDVAGRCPTTYATEKKGWYSTSIKRSKDLLACTDRHDYQTALAAKPYTTTSVSLPLLTSS